MRVVPRHHRSVRLHAVPGVRLTPEGVSGRRALGLLLRAVLRHREAPAADPVHRRPADERDGDERRSPSGARLVDEPVGGTPVRQRGRVRALLLEVVEEPVRRVVGHVQLPGVPRDAVAAPPAERPPDPPGLGRAPEVDSEDQRTDRTAVAGRVDGDRDGRPGLGKRGRPPGRDDVVDVDRRLRAAGVVLEPEAVHGGGGVEAETGERDADLRPRPRRDRAAGDEAREEGRGPRHAGAREEREPDLLVPGAAAVHPELDRVVGPRREPRVGVEVERAPAGRDERDRRRPAMDDRGLAHRVGRPAPVGKAVPELVVVDGERLGRLCRGGADERRDENPDGDRGQTGRVYPSHSNRSLFKLEKLSGRQGVILRGPV